MTTVTTSVPNKTARKSRKLKKSNVVDAGLQENLSNKEIITSIQNAFPGSTEKSIRNLISVRRSKLKKNPVVTAPVAESNGTSV